MTEKQRSNLQNNSIHLGCQQIADVLIENNVTLAKVIQQLEVRPTMNAVKDIFRAIAKAKYGIESTSQLQSNQVTEVWDDLIKAVSESTGVFIEFPNRESTINYE